MARDAAQLPPHRRREIRDDLALLLPRAAPRSLHEHHKVLPGQLVAAMAYRIEARTPIGFGSGKEGLQAVPFGIC